MPVGRDWYFLPARNDLKKKSLRARSGEYGGKGGGDRAKQLLFLSLKNAVTIVEV